MTRLLVLLLSAYLQSAQLTGPIPTTHPALAQATEAARKAGLKDITTYPKQSFALSSNGAILGTFLSLGARTALSPYQCLHTFIPAGAGIAPSSVITAGAGLLGTDICDHPRAVTILPSPPGQIRIGILYANSDYLNANHDAGADAPPVSAALLIDPTTRKMTLDAQATQTLQKAGATSLQAMRALF